MNLYEVIDLVSKDLEPENPDRMVEYLKGCLDDNGEFLRSRFCKRHEGDLANREIGDIMYVVYGTSKVYEPRQELFFQAHKIENIGTLSIQIMWGDRKEYIEEDIALCKELNFANHKTIMI